MTPLTYKTACQLKSGTKIIAIDPGNYLKLNQIYIFNKIDSMNLIKVEGIQYTFFPHRFALALVFPKNFPLETEGGNV